MVAAQYPVLLKKLILVSSAPFIAIQGVKEPLSANLKDFKFILLEKCGHTPWIEKFARDN